MKIGAFSNASKISKRMLRYYDEKGLLKPRIDENGYRQYVSNDLKTAEQIKHLRDLNFQVEEILKFIESDKEEKEALLREKFLEVEKDIDSNEAVLIRLTSQVAAPKTLSWHNTYKISRFSEDEYYAVEVRGIMNELQIDEAFSDLYHGVLSKSLLEKYKGDFGKPFSIIHAVLDHGKFDVTLGLPIFPEASSMVADKLIFNKSYRISKYEASEVIQTIHYGGYEKLGGAYQALYKYAEENNLLLKNFCKEIYVTDASLVRNSEDFVTIVQAYIEIF